MRRPGYLGNCDVMRPRQLNGFGYTPFSAPKTTITEPPAITGTPAETLLAIQQIMNKSQSGQPLTAQETILLQQLQLQQQQFATGAA